jgi:hypothetical protein
MPAKILKCHIFFIPAKIFPKAWAQSGREFQEIKPAGVRLFADFHPVIYPDMVAAEKLGEAASILRFYVHA